ncbi:hypothetical protein EFQ99_10190 [Rhizobium vallis]|uniref:Uncharacterized protein n=1 Tax=Rhizobium vallis TaxID=634290 RepID=A0A3S0RA32_9HYPH|nr:hypothetical protein [Rhizobium vallis]RUM25144.1 hypothetical protein EFQ99_10190 [Rhizobium vallis]
MFVSPREAADLGLQIAIALALTVTGMAIASSATGGVKVGISALDVSRPSLWTAVPMHIDPATQAYLRADPPTGLEFAARADDVCHDQIGLRLSCDLIATSSTAF